MTAQKLIEASDAMPFMAWKARARDYLGEGAPQLKAELIEALEERAKTETPQAEAEQPVPEGAVEVDLIKKYAPFHLMDEDGNWIPQGEVTQAVPAGPTYLRMDEAQRVLERGQAKPTANTFAQMRA